MGSDRPQWQSRSVRDLQSDGLLLVEDGNHGEYRPRPHEFSDEGVSFIRAADMANGRVLFESAQCINETAMARIRKGIGAGGDVILSHKGTVGKVAYVPENAPPFVCSPQTTFWRSLDNNRINRRYLCAFLNSQTFHDQLFARANETDMAGYVSLTAQRELSVVLPPLPEQKAIAHVLGSLDDKIELNRRMNATLEGMAQAIFKSWFVDFDPVIDNALVAGNPIPDQLAKRAELRRKALADGSANRNTAKQFPDAFKLTEEMGWIPEGWSDDHLRQHIDAIKGLSYKGAYLCEETEGMALQNLNSVYEGGGYKYEGIKWYFGEHKDRHVVYPGDLLVTNTEQGFGFLLIGYPAIVPEHFEEALFSHHLYCVRPRESTHLTPVFFYHLLRDGWFHRIVSGYTNGTTVNMLPPDGLEKPRFVVPTEDVYLQFDTIAQNALAKAEAIHFENRKLAAIRDALLPKLISGELRIPDAERLAKEVSV